MKKIFKSGKINEISKRSGESFVCQTCQQTFDYSKDSEWSEKDAVKEFKENHPECQNDNLGIVCDDCHIKILAWIKTLTPEEKLRMRKDYEKQSSK